MQTCDMMMAAAAGPGLAINVLIVIDMQYDFIDGALANPAAQAIVKPICDEIKNGNYDRVIFTRDTHGFSYLDTAEGRKLPIKHCIEGTKGWLVHEDILKAVADKGILFEYVDKPTFGYKHWDKHFQFCGTANITIVGTCTDICVVSNALALKAVLPEANIRVIGDLCAGLTPALHQSALDVMSSCQIGICYTQPQA